MSFVEVAKNLTPEIYQVFKKSLELGRWPDGRTMSGEQKTICMDAVIAYENANDVPEEQRVGYIAKDKPTPYDLKAGTTSNDNSGMGVWAPDTANQPRH